MAIKGNKNAGLNVGRLIDEVRIRKRVSYAVLSRLSDRSITSVSDAMKRSSIQTYMVWEFSEALKHDFFADLSDQLRQNTTKELDNGPAILHQELEQLRIENQRLERELEYLRKTMDVLLDQRNRP